MNTEKHRVYLYGLAMDNGVSERRLDEEAIGAFIADVALLLATYDLESEGRTVRAKEIREQLGL